VDIENGALRRLEFGNVEDKDEKKALKQKARQEYNEQLTAKRQHLNDDSITEIHSWQKSFYKNWVERENYSVDQSIVKTYFPLESVLAGLFQITQNLFGVEYVHVDNASVWHPDVKMYEVHDNGKRIGIFYLDLHPRPNKYTHAACFGIISGKAWPQGYQIPVASLVCNFPEPTESKPALMSHDQVETFFHEFGHVLHNMLTTTELSGFSGTSVARDFVEAPSQIFENWVWNYESLKLFAKHYKTGEVLPRELYNNMLRAKNVNSGNNTLQQIFYGLIDMTLHDGFDPEGDLTTTDVVKKLQKEVTLYKFINGTNFQAAFGHLTGYAAGYYGYLWSQIYAQDMFSVFEKNGIMDPATGKRYRDIILAKGGSVDALELVKEFLQREPNQDAFLRSLGLTETN
jgi:thimet oligopeptidase